jgi:TRAP-type C4-dicarboxylate transport system permease small subunit
MAQLMKILLWIVAVFILALVAVVAANMVTLYRLRKKMKILEQQEKFQAWMFKILSFDEEDK